MPEITVKDRNTRLKITKDDHNKVRNYYKISKYETKHDQKNQNEAKNYYKKVQT